VAKVTPTGDYPCVRRAKPTWRSSCPTRPCAFLNAVAARLRLPDDRVFINVQEYGNTGSASGSVALWEARDQVRIKPGDLVLLTAFDSYRLPAGRSRAHPGPCGASVRSPAAHGRSKKRLIELTIRSACAICVAAFASAAAPALDASIPARA